MFVHVWYTLIVLDDIFPYVQGGMAYLPWRIEQNCFPHWPIVFHGMEKEKKASF